MTVYERGASWYKHTMSLEGMEHWANHAPSGASSLLKGRVFLQSHPAPAGQYIAPHPGRSMFLRSILYNDSAPLGAGIYSAGIDERDAGSSRHGLFVRHGNVNLALFLMTVHERGASWYKHTTSFKYLIN